VLRRSSLYETEPVDFLAQPWFFELRGGGGNFADAEQLLHALQGIERAFGSRKLVARGPRIIDLDILFYGARMIRTEEMEIPHPRMAERRFVLVPLAELAPGLRHPVLWRNDCRIDRRREGQEHVQLWQPQRIDVQ